VQVLGVVVCGCEAPLLLDRPPPRRDAARLPITPYPDAFERQYRAALRPLLDDLAGLTQDLVGMLDDYTADASRARLAEERRKQLAAKLQTMRDAVLARWTTKRIVGNIPLERIVDGVDRLNEKATIAQVARSSGMLPTIRLVVHRASTASRIVCSFAASCLRRSSASRALEASAV
jgi:hypothetical protein